MEQRLSLVTLGVRDLAASRAFYKRLGWTESSAGNDEVAFFQCGGFVFALWGRKALADDAGVQAGNGGFANVSLAYNVRHKGEVDATLEDAVKAGARMLRAAADTSWGGRTGYFADPDGFAWEVAWNPGFEILPDGGIRLPR
jgi:catechol 2,3-dioxygenase-like lactoylglutathione lyase family enzyme